jgi:hypothetical protein
VEKSFLLSQATSLGQGLAKELTPDEAIQAAFSTIYPIR